MDPFILIENIFHKNICNFDYKIKKIYFLYSILYIKNIIKNKFFFKKQEVTFIYYYDIINNFLIINYISDINVFHLYMYYLNKQNFFLQKIFSNERNPAYDIIIAYMGDIITVTGLQQQWLLLSNRDIRRYLQLPQIF